MFTGLIQSIGTLHQNMPKAQGRHIVIHAPELPEPQIGASIAVNGVCLTVTEYANRYVTFYAMNETIKRTTLDTLQAGKKVNLEPAMRLGDPLDGHIVQGHVDTTTKLIKIKHVGDSQLWTFKMPTVIAPLITQKGSVAIDGISLTVVDVELEYFSVSIIPHTRRKTILHTLSIGDNANIEADVIARYAQRMLQRSAINKGITESFLRENGF